MGRESEILLGKIFLPGGENLKEEWFWQSELFSKLKTAFCAYWTSIQIKISMTCVSREHEIKTKMVQKQWRQLGLQLENLYLLRRGDDFWWEGNKNLLGGSLLGGNFSGEGGMSELLAGEIGRDSLSIPSCYIPFDLKFYVDYEC